MQPGWGPEARFGGTKTQKHLVFDGLRRPTVLPEGGAETSFEAKKCKNNMFLNAFCEQPCFQDWAGRSRTWQDLEGSAGCAGRSWEGYGEGGVSLIENFASDIRRPCSTRVRRI